MGVADRSGFAALPKLPTEGDSGAKDTETSNTIRSVPDPSFRPFDNLASLTSAHTNLDARLTPFWSKALTSRRIKFAVYTIQGSTDTHLLEGMKTDPLWETTTSTDDQGLFTEHIVIPWDRLCTHPPSIAMACCDPKDSGTSDWRLLLKAGIDRASDGEEDSITRGAEHRQGSSQQSQELPLHSNGKQDHGARAPHPLENAVDQARGIIANHLSVPASTQITIAVSEPKGVRVISDLVSCPGCSMY